MANRRTLATVAKPPLANDVDDFAFKDTPINRRWCEISSAALHRSTAQRRPRWRNRNRQDASGHRPKLHPTKIARALL
jgi:hypothetical protein